MPKAISFKSFETELNRLAESFGKRLAELKQPGYAEAQLRDDFLNPFFRALGWDMEHRAGLIPREREVEIESATQIGVGRKRADYLFRTDKRDRFVCEAKKPAEELHARSAFQAKRYGWNKGVPVAVLTDFEELKIYIVGGKPHIDEPHVGEWKSWNFQQYPLIARELWDLLAHEKVAAGSIDRALDALPKRATGTGKARQQWLIKPDRTRALDTDFLEFLDETRRDLASDLWKNNQHDELLEDNKLTQACQRVIDRILFLRICEDRDIDTGERLQTIVEKWRKNTGNYDTGRRAHQQPLDLMREEPPADFGGSGIRAPKDSLWRAVVRHFRALDRRPPTHVPFFNGNLFQPDFTETLVIGDEWLAGFIGDLSDDESPYLFNVIDVEILGSVYERFLGKVVRPQGRGITIEEKPEVRKAGGVYYTPRYIVDYIVEQTAGKLLDEIAAEKETENAKAFALRTEKLRLLDPACGSGSFLIRAFERVCEHWLRWLTGHLPAKAERPTGVDWGKFSQAPVGTKPDAPAKDARSEWLKRHRKLCWLDESTGDLHLTIHLKRLILTHNIYGVDLDAAAVEVTQLSLYLKMLEHENRTTLQRQRELLADEADIALLPPLQDNIKCGNSLIASDFSMMPEDLVRVHAFDWPVQFAPIMKAAGFDAIIGNPPYIFTRNEGIAEEEKEYFYREYKHQSIQLNTFGVFVEKSHSLLKTDGLLGFITPNNWLTIDTFMPLRAFILRETGKLKITNILDRVFEAADVDTCIVVFHKGKPDSLTVAEMSKEREVFTRSLEPSIISPPSFIIQIGLLKDAKSQILLTKIEKSSEPLSAVATVSTGLKAYQTGKGKPKQTDKQKDGRVFHATTKRDSSYAKYLDGVDVCRYSLGWSGEWLSYGDWLAEPRRSVPFDGDRILVRQIPSSPPYLVHGVFTSGKFYNDINSMIIFAPSQDASLKFLLGVINSRLVSFWFEKKFDKLQRKIFPQFKVKELADFPIPKIDFKKPADKARHDKLVMLVDKMLGLMPKLRAATAESEKAVLQNAVTATDQQIDQLVYELYNLTPEEIALVEGAV